MDAVSGVCASLPSFPPSCLAVSGFVDDTLLAVFPLVISLAAISSKKCFVTRVQEHMMLLAFLEQQVLLGTVTHPLVFFLALAREHFLSLSYGLDYTTTWETHAWCGHLTFTMTQ